MQDTQKNTNDTKKPSVDEEKILREASKLAESKSQKNYEKLKEDLVNSLAGRNEDKLPWEREGKKDPDSWDQVVKTAEERAYKRAEDAFEKKLKALEEKREKLKQKESKKYQEELARRHQENSRDFMELVDEGKIQLENEIKEKLLKGEQLTKSEQENSKGIKQWKKLRDLAYENKTSVYKAFHKYYDKEPVGANAPVFGTRGASIKTQNDDYTYEDIKKMRKEYGL